MFYSDDKLQPTWIVRAFLAIPTNSVPDMIFSPFLQCGAGLMVVAIRNWARELLWRRSSIRKLGQTSPIVRQLSP
jgi:hypothetical protein